MFLAFFFIVLTLFILLSWSQNKACVTLDRYFILALNNVAVWSSHAVINFIGNHFETHHVLSSFYFFKKSLKTGIWVGFLVPNAWYLQGKYIHKQFGSILTSYHQDRCQEIKFFVGSIFSGFHLPKQFTS